MGTAVERTPSGRRLVVTREMEAPQERVWDILIDTEQWPTWGPSVRGVETTSRYIQRGTSGRVQLPGGVWVPFKITTCEDLRWTWRVARVPATGHRVQKRRGGSVAGFEIPLYAAGYVPVCRRALTRIEEIAMPT